MRQSKEKDRYSVAWFKLAEFVARGEKERALGIYKLLALSLNKPAFALKLEGDILLAFGDHQNAIAKYLQSTIFYNNEHNYQEAAAICEHVLSIDPYRIDFLRRLQELYTALENKPKLITTLERLISLLRHRHQFQEADDLFVELQALSPAVPQYTNNTQHHGTW